MCRHAGWQLMMHRCTSVSKVMTATRRTPPPCDVTHRNHNFHKCGFRGKTTCRCQKSPLMPHLPVFHDAQTIDSLQHKQTHVGLSTKQNKIVFGQAKLILWLFLLDQTGGPGFEGGLLGMMSGVRSSTWQRYYSSFYCSISFKQRLSWRLKSQLQKRLSDFFYFNPYGN